MSGTAKTITALSAEAASPNQVILDIVATLASRTAYGQINIVTEPEFGADPTGVASSTNAFNAALSGGATVIIPPGRYKVGNITVPNGASLIGFTSGSYGNNFATAGRTVLVPDSGALINGSGAINSILSVSGATNIFLSGLEINCDSSSDGSEVQSTVWCGVSGGGSFIILDAVTIRMALVGLGDTAGNTSNVYRISNSTFFKCGIGISEIVDGWISSTFLSACVTGAVFSANKSGSITLVGCRVEWSGKSIETSASPGANQGYGIVLNGNVSNIIISSTTFDRNAIAGMYISGAFNTSIVGCLFSRNGNYNGSSSTALAARSHLQLNGANIVQVSGCISSYGQGDSGDTGIYSPAQWVYSQGQNQNISFIGNQLGGASSSAWPIPFATFWSGVAASSLIFLGNLNVVSP